VIDAIPDDFFLARELSHFLDRLPLALDQAGAYIAETGCSLQHYLDLYEHFRPPLLDRHNAERQSGHRRENDHPESVLMTFWIAWEQLQTQNPLAGKAARFWLLIRSQNNLYTLEFFSLGRKEPKTT